jgi:molybdate transport system ATP-binding protein
LSLRAAVTVALGTLRLDVELEVGEGEVVALLGPNGAGKTTVLRALAGLLPVDAGRIALDGVALDEPATGAWVPTERRPIGFVFQDYLLFPHLSVLENVAFGLRARGSGGGRPRETTARWLHEVGLESIAGSRPSELSGGQRQRVALARALATNPRLLLLDEPLAAMDATARAETRRVLKRHLSTFGGLRLLVTHDPLDAVTLADRLVVMEDGVVTQAGTPAEVTARPRSSYVADLVGLNLLQGHANGGAIRLPGGGVLSAAGDASGGVFAVIHPRIVALYRQRPEGSPRNVWPGDVVGLEMLGDRVRVRVGGDIPLVAEVTPAAAAQLALARGGSVWVSVKATEVDVYPA